MNRSVFTFCMAIAVAAAACISSQAATMNLSLNYVGAIDGGTFNPVPSASLNAQSAPHSGSPIAAASASASNILHQFDVFMSLGGAPTNENFQALQFDMQLGPGLTPASFGGWVANNPQYDPPGPPPIINTYDQNVDSGTANDLQTIRVLALSQNAAIINNRPGVAAPALIGSVFVSWDGSATVDGKSFIGFVPPTQGSNPFGLYVDGVATAQPASLMTVGARSEWVSIPEPGSAALLGLAFIGGLGYLRRR